jgi:hypothetical protein
MHKKTFKYHKILKFIYKILTTLFFINTGIVFLFVNKCIIWDNVMIKKGLEIFKLFMGGERET